MKHEVDTACLEPYEYISETPGKDVRGQLIDAFNVWLAIPADRVDAIKGIISMLHNASLLVDDIEDGSMLRRGKPVAHAIFGTPQTLNAANYVYFLALEACHGLGSADATAVFVEELLNLHRGQGQDIRWRDANTAPSEAAYAAMVLDKTGGLFRLAVGLMAAFSGSRSRAEFRPLVDALALYFQIRDDLVNLRSDDYMRSKSYCEDLTEGKFSFPILHAVHANLDDRRLLNILQQRTENADVKRHAVEYMERVGSFDYTRDKLRGLKLEIEAEIAKLGGHAKLTALLDQLDKQITDAPPPAPGAPLPPPPGSPPDDRGRTHFDAL